MKKVIEVKNMILLPPPPGKCRECAVDHSAENPHDATSLYYSVKFNMDNKRAPTWEDALAHCREEIKEHWRRELTALGIDTHSTNKRPKSGIEAASEERQKR